MIKTVFEEKTDGGIMTKFENKNGMKVFFCNKGASIFGIFFSSISGKLENIVMTPSTYETWNENRTFSGSIVGPLAGRYHTAKTNFNLELNRPPVHFHGGTGGLDTLYWNQEIVEKTDSVVLIYRYTDNSTSTDFEVIYTFTDTDELLMEITASTDTESFVNPTNHVYFNLNGNPFKPITNHCLKLDSNMIYLEDDNQLITDLKRISPHSEYDFSNGKSLLCLEKTGGLNTTFALHGSKKGSIYNPDNGIKVTIKTTLPAVVIYTFNFSQDVFSSDLKPYPKFAGMTFETQYPSNNLGIVKISKENNYYSRTDFLFSLE